MSEQKHDWTYDQRLNNGRGAYRDAVTGRVISQQKATELIDTSIDRTREDVTRQVNTMLADGRMSVADWQKAMAQTIKDAYIQQAELAAGGHDSMTQAMWGSLSTPLREQYTYLSSFAEEIADHKLSAAQIQMRSDMYISSAREGYWRVADRKMREQGFDEELWINKDANACDACREAAEMGWVKIGTLTQPGSGNVLRNPPTKCAGLVLCRCQKSYR